MNQLNPFPDMATCLNHSTWNTRGWTFQERIASKALLHFTEYGLFLEVGSTETKMQYAEGPVPGKSKTDFVKISSSYSKDVSTLSKDTLRAMSGRSIPGLKGDLSSKEEFATTVSSYSERTLTYPSDILRAFSGLLIALYGQKTSFGTP